MKVRYLFFLFVLLILSCAQKVCPKPEEVLKEVFKKPENGSYYGYIKVNFLRIPILIEKRGEKERVKVGYEGVSIRTNILCFQKTCFEFPFKPSEIIYGYFPGRYRVEKCNGELVLKSEDGKEMHLKNGTIKLLKYGTLSLVYGKRSPKGYFKNIVIKINNLEAKLIIEGREV